MRKRGRFLSWEDSLQLCSSGELMFSHSVIHPVFSRLFSERELFVFCFVF